MEQFLLDDFLITIIVGLYFIVSSVLVHGAMVDRLALPAWLRPRIPADDVAADPPVSTDPGEPEQETSQSGARHDTSEADSKTPLQSMTFAAIVMSALFLGLLANVLSDSMVRLSGDIRVPVFVPEQENRAAVLFDEKGAKPLGEHLQRLGVFAAVGGEHGRYADGILRRESVAGADHERMRKAASAVYYHTKNVVYDRPNYYKEMAHLQRQIDFMRSLAAITLLQAIYAVGMLVFRKPGSVRPGIIERWRGVRQSQAGLATRWSRSVFVLLIVMLFFTCQYTFEVLEQEFNKRAYGYYASIVEQGLIDRIVPRTTTVPTESLSGMAWIPATQANGPPRYLVVHDRKRPADGARFGLLEVREGLVCYTPLSFLATADFAPPSDLESVCRIPDRELEFLAAESGHFDPDEPGRLLHVKLLECGSAPPMVEILRAYPLPAALGTRDPDSNAARWDQIEGITCRVDGEGRLQVVLGERARGDLYRAVLDEEAGSLEVTKIPGAGPPEGFERAIADLFFDARRQEFLAVATSEVEAGDGLGPFASVIYTLARADLAPIPKDQWQELWRIDALKVEALAATPWRDRPFCIGTDDEDLGGCWRLLRPSRHDL